MHELLHLCLVEQDILTSEVLAVVVASWQNNDIGICLPFAAEHMNCGVVAVYSGVVQLVGGGFQEHLLVVKGKILHLDLRRDLVR